MRRGYPSASVPTEKRDWGVGRQSSCRHDFIVPEVRRVWHDDGTWLEPLARRSGGDSLQAELEP